MHTEKHGTGKSCVFYEKLDYFPGCNLSMIMLSVRRQGAARFQNCHPLDSVDISSNLLSCRQKDMIFNIENARSAVGTFQVFAEADKLPALVMRHGCVRNSLEELRALKNIFEKIVSAPLKHPFCISRTEEKEHAIDLFPHFDGHLFPNGSSVLTCRSEAGINLIRVSAGECSELNNRILGDFGVVLSEQFVVFEREDD